MSPTASTSVSCIHTSVPRALTSPNGTHDPDGRYAIPPHTEITVGQEHPRNSPTLAEIITSAPSHTL
jgi:hypothetical protein